jgi:malate dehydrogenase
LYGSKTAESVLATYSISRRDIVDKITILGAGNVGTAAAFYLAEKRVANVMLIDKVEGRARGKALDLMEAAPIRGYDVYVEGSDETKSMKGSKVVVIAAGVVRKPEMLRQDLLEHNIKVMDELIPEIKKNAENAIIINLAEPVDTLTYYLIKKGGFDKKRVMGVSGALDSTRLREFIAQELDVASVDTTALILGGHHDYMLIPPRYARVEGVPITELLSEEKVEALVARTRKAGSEIVESLKNGSAANAPGAAVAEMVEAVIRNTKRIICAPAYLSGEYGHKDICLGVPVMLSKMGIEKIVELELTLAEKEAFDKSAAIVKNTLNNLDIIPDKKEG